MVRLHVMRGARRCDSRTFGCQQERADWRVQRVLELPASITILAQTPGFVRWSRNNPLGTEDWVNVAVRLYSPTPTGASGISQSGQSIDAPSFSVRPAAMVTHGLLCHGGR